MAKLYRHRLQNALSLCRLLYQSPVSCRLFPHGYYLLPCCTTPRHYLPLVCLLSSKALYLGMTPQGMVEMITGLTVAARIVTYVADYQSYKRSQRKEDDLAVRRFIMNRANSAKGQAKNILKWAYKNHVLVILTGHGY